MSRFVYVLLLIKMLIHFSNGEVLFSSASPSFLTKIYIAMSTEMDPGSRNAGQLFIVSSSNTTSDVWLNAAKQTNVYNISPLGAYEVTLSGNSIMPNGSVNVFYGLSLVSRETKDIFYRNKWSFFQLREKQHLSKKYIAVTYNKNNTGMKSVLSITPMFDRTTVTLTFRNETNVTEVVGGITGGVSINGLKAVFGKLGYRTVLKLESDQDLTGTIVSCSEPVSLVAGSTSLPADGLGGYVDHLIGADETGTEYIVFGLPNVTGSDVCRIVAQVSNTNVSINNTEISLSKPGDFYETNISRNSFTYIEATNQVTVAMLLDNGNETSSDMIIALPVGFKHSLKYNFVIPPTDSDEVVQPYVVVTTTLNGRDDIKLNDDILPVDTVWIDVPGTSYTGAYIPLQASTTTRQHITNTKDIPFNAYLLGHGIDVTYGSALLSTADPQEITDPFKFSLNGTYCERTNKIGNYNSGGTPMEVKVLKGISKKRRRVSYDVKHFHMQQLQACQMICFLYKDCIGVNFNVVAPSGEVNCDIVMPGLYCFLKDTHWTFYLFK